MHNEINPMFGTSVSVVEANIENAHNVNMRMAGMLSDAQELISSFQNFSTVAFPFGHPRTWLFYLFNQLEEKDFHDEKGM